MFTSGFELGRLPNEITCKTFTTYQLSHRGIKILWLVFAIKGWHLGAIQLLILSRHFHHFRLLLDRKSGHASTCGPRRSMSQFNTVSWSHYDDLGVSATALHINSGISTAMRSSGQESAANPLVNSFILFSTTGYLTGLRWGEQVQVGL